MVELRQAQIILSVMVLFLNLVNSISGIDLGYFSLANMLDHFHMGSMEVNAGPVINRIGGLNNAAYE